MNRAITHKRDPREPFEERPAIAPEIAQVAAAGRVRRSCWVCGAECWSFRVVKDDAVLCDTCADFEVRALEELHEKRMPRPRTNEAKDDLHRRRPLARPFPRKTAAPAQLGAYVPSPRAARALEDMKLALGEAPEDR